MLRIDGLVQSISEATHHLIRSTDQMLEVESSIKNKLATVSTKHIVLGREEVLSQILDEVDRHKVVIGSTYCWNANLMMQQNIQSEKRLAEQSV